MHTPSRGACAALGIAALVGACAAAPQGAAPPATPPADCAALSAAIAQADSTRQAASDRQGDAWKAVVPFAVAARYAKGRAAEGQADQQLAELRTESERRDCAR